MREGLGGRRGLREREGPPVPAAPPAAPGVAGVEEARVHGAGGVGAEAELQEVLAGLESMASDMKELVVFLSCYPPARREPYSGHLWLENRMFGREAEQEKIISFLLGPEPAEDPGVLPVIGRPRVGKSTLVEHVCLDERVREHFSLIVFFGQGDIEDGKLSSSSPHLEDNGRIKHKHRDLDPAGKSLVVIELVEDVVTHGGKEHCLICEDDAPCQSAKSSSQVDQRRLQVWGQHKLWS